MEFKLDSDVFLQKIADTAVEEIPTPCHPDTRYPEYRFAQTSASRNYVYEAVREVFRQMDYDRENFGSERWNPLGEFIRPGHTVLIKPNMVLHKNYKKGEDYTSVVTHPALVRCIVDYVYIALGGRGRIVIGDAPINSADFEAICQNMGLASLQEIYREKGFSVEVADFRLYTMEKDERGVIRNKKTVDSKDNHMVVRFDSDSLLAEFSDSYKNFRVTEYDGDDMPLRHNAESHEYCVHRSVFESDVLISLPKIKTHHKAGYTCAMKNYIGINGSKDWLPHHRKHSAFEGGDEYLHKSLRKRLKSASWDIRWKLDSVLLQTALRTFERALDASRRIVPFKDPFFEGSWWGNRTISRTVNDLNRAVIYGDKQGTLRDTPQRKILYMVDGIICGEGEGPMGATAKRCNMLVWASNAFAADMVVVTLMGFDHTLIDTLKVCQTILKYKVFGGTPEEIRIRTNLETGQHSLSTIRRILKFTFIPPRGWRGHIELPAEQ